MNNNLKFMYGTICMCCKYRPYIALKKDNNICDMIKVYMCYA